MRFILIHSHVRRGFQVDQSLQEDPENGKTWWLNYQQSDLWTEMMEISY